MMPAEGSSSWAVSTVVWKKLSTFSHTNETMSLGLMKVRPVWLNYPSDDFSHEAPMTCLHGSRSSLTCSAVRPPRPVRSATIVASTAS